jgi:hypothetical protein
LSTCPNLPTPWFQYTSFSTGYRFNTRQTGNNTHTNRHMHCWTCILPLQLDSIAPHPRLIAGKGSRCPHKDMVVPFVWAIYNNAQWFSALQKQFTTCPRRSSGPPANPDHPFRLWLVLDEPKSELANFLAVFIWGVEKISELADS